MKKILLILTLMISFNSYGEWWKFTTSVDGDTFYIDTDTIKEHKGYIYYWRLTDFLKPTEYGIMSVKSYYQGDCGVNRYKPLSYIWYKQPMGRGTGDTDNTPDEWKYPVPESIGGTVLKFVCDYVD